MAGFHRCADLHDDHLLSWESPRPEGATISAVGNRYVPQMISPALTDARIFMMLTSSWESATPEGAPTPVVRNDQLPQTT
jgi:hypothetical protein